MSKADRERFKRHRATVQAMAEAASDIPPEAAAPEGVCEPCATGVGARVPEGHQPTWWRGRCLLCGTVTGVTAPRDFGRTRRVVELAIQQKTGGG